MIRELVSKITGLLAKQTNSVRKQASLPIKLTFEPVRGTGRLLSQNGRATINGETSDLSVTGVGFIVPAIRVQENYLVGQDRTLVAEIDLPDGKVSMRVIGRRYEKFGIHLSTEKYIIGAEILEMDKNDRKLYENYIRQGAKNKHSAAEVKLEQS